MSGAGVNINPIAFLIVEESGVKLLPINHSGAVDRIIDFIPDFLEKANCSIEKILNKKDEKELKKEDNKKENENIKIPKSKTKNIKDIQIEYDDTKDTTQYLEDE